MKRLFALFSLTALALTACGPKAQPGTYVDTWSHIAEAAQSNDCKVLALYMTERLQFTDQDCAEVSALVQDGAFDEINWDSTKMEESDTKAITYLKDGSKLTHFLLGDDKVWRADTIFWR